MKLSSLPKTWVIDVDGTIVKHNGYLVDGFDTLLDGVKDFFAQILPEDKVVLVTARKTEYIEDLKKFLKEQGIRYDYLLTDMPVGERILVNDEKPSGLKTAYSVNLQRNGNFNIKYEISEEL